ncbi:MAG: arginine--tRNA ligase [Candidatus Yanofskybacteria bacterium RIFCSPHIGHO2_02_FULL_44_12b]|uniref:Arginine--tRNA ligase n=2 Tax=Candidatus Yanofskyibacteriota TaxID=1752733 RepID=A0A1F8GKR0_9BACT|nr:MAG: Arginine-tRNA ligase [Candidatus Yanofskybacteria bacterium GW2011_GWA2_44_9]OGN04035.1 MAG: arginine--tRNA ligase [Candidatus Yanofskybacteria bacterium RIFCSPHIGHO2_01_FULL_44_24]OGN15366.1 MAG: arginine--tRNA ligase [Candidatus Yanofskybacteria bacterium RIFCSPHIGHO2_02_FULL_44_12b]OGN25992.1 MAG: arginine--tRNA ligase [Candidatus Yanofskybacteria bacterium RIFCSPLOWO2_01_FULL_44_22]
MVKHLIRQIISREYPGADFGILIPPDPNMGDYSVNLAFIVAKKEKKNPEDMARQMADQFSRDTELNKYFEKIEPAGGFINFFLSESFLHRELLKIVQEKDGFGSAKEKNFKINLEFVSANPTGPLTVANIRAASFGDALGNVLKKAGYQVTKEYYINDVGVQIRTLGESVAKRYLQLKGKDIDFEENLYQGEYIIQAAKEIKESNLIGPDENFDEVADKCRKYATQKFIDSARSSLGDLGVKFDVWFSESKLHESGEVAAVLSDLKKAGHTKEKDGAIWLVFGGDKEAVLVKSDRSTSYLMNDIAYTKNKFKRGFDRAINIWGADHHGDVPRLLAGSEALGFSPDKLKVLLHQLVLIKKQDEFQRMSKRKGEFVLLSDLLKEVGRDAIRFFFMAKDLSTHMDFDIDLAEEQSKKNPVFYIQYASARLNSIFNKSQESRESGVIKRADAGLLKEKEELGLMRKMSKFPELIEEVSETYQIHQLAQYAFELAGDFHNFYEKHRVMHDNKKLEEARLLLCWAVDLVLKNCLGLMGISAVEKM